ncbi:MAG: rRNA pseudouridine synthase [Tannerellaceae bacterium]|jgi:23S rRNA pseudouridine2605 synthase|nr:rRNA pseudouridine synthase [Tannerellaceae bacterium]
MKIEEQEERPDEKKKVDETSQPSRKVVLLPKRKRLRVGEMSRAITHSQVEDRQNNGERGYSRNINNYRQSEGSYPRTPRSVTTRQDSRPQGGWTPHISDTNRRPILRQQSFSSGVPRHGHQRQVKYKEPFADPMQLIRLNKFIANAGVCSRREADEYICSGVIKVNDVVVTELGTKITRRDKVFFHDKEVRGESKVYILLNKPKNCVTTTTDPEARMTVSKLVRTACRERIYPVGRLDRNTTGVILLTNDGDLASKLTHPAYKKKKIYHVWLDKEVIPEDLQRIATGIELDDGEIHADAISYAEESDKTQVGIELHSGRNHLVRRIFGSLGYNVVKLDRVYFAGLTKKNLGRGKWRFLNEREVNALRMGIFE